MMQQGTCVSRPHPRPRHSAANASVQLDQAAGRVILVPVTRRCDAKIVVAGRDRVVTPGQRYRTSPI